MSRFEEVLGEEPHRTLLKEIFNQQIRTLAEAVADLGEDTAGDATALSARVATKATAKKEIAEGLPQPSGGRKEYTEDDGTVTKVVEWFGYKLHLLVDVKHEVLSQLQSAQVQSRGASTRCARLARMRRLRRSSKPGGLGPRMGPGETVFKPSTPW